MNKTIYNWTGKTILLVEDDQPSYLFLKYMIESTNAKFLLAKTGGEALSFFTNKAKIDLILLDIKLPDFSGLTVVEEIRKAGSEIPVIAQTAYALTLDREKAIESGCNEYLIKPLHRDALFELMDQYL
ncbi:MAG: response regulator [Salinivirgaceae bacterium]|nr:response regulator [Salinivirgaceae bacterium]MDD4746218.1 response regulator [Salinivirgaceae bacterium]MDY0279379.1 response regulator [Salinivirgaceae bacterium]